MKECTCDLCKEYGDYECANCGMDLCDNCAHVAWFGGDEFIRHDVCNNCGSDKLYTI